MKNPSKSTVQPNLTVTLRTVRDHPKDRSQEIIMILKNAIMKRSKSHVGTVFQFGDNVCMKGEQHAHAQRMFKNQAILTAYPLISAGSLETMPYE